MARKTISAHALELNTVEQNTKAGDLLGFPGFMSHGGRIPDEVICDSNGYPYFSSGTIGSNDEYEPHPYLVGYLVNPAKIIQAKIVGAALSAEIELDQLVIDSPDPDVAADYEGRARQGKFRILPAIGSASYQFYNDWSGLQFRVNAEDSAPAVYCDGEAFLLDCRDAVVNGAYALGECARYSALILCHRGWARRILTTWMMSISPLASSSRP